MRFENGEGAGDDGIDAAQLLLRRCLAGKIENALDNFPAAGGFPYDDIQIRPGRLVGDGLAQQVGEGHDAGEGIVELMRHPGGELPQR